jgi:ribonuclease I
MTLHGLWPNLISGANFPDCNKGDDIIVNIEDNSLLDSMRQMWISYSGADENFWSHEYNKHGLCYSNKTQTESYINFFSKVIEIFKHNDFENIISDIVDSSTEAEISMTTHELRESISKKYPYIKYDFYCKKFDNKFHLVEIRINLDLDFNNIEFTRARTNCPTSQPIFISKFIQ